MSRVAWIVGVALIVTGCRGALGGQTTAEWSDSGRLCIVPEDVAVDVVSGNPPETVDYTAGDNLVAIVTFSDCESCVRANSASCEVFDGEVPQVVESQATYIVDESLCDEPCESLFALCDVPPISGGARSYLHGGSILVVEVPSTSARFCSGEPEQPELREN
ncbi:MAG: hypothetical protein KTR31_25455 [Myxococcales bacterium]|nr:hypothetical protein [Myxococcales bacterium]